MSSVWAHGPITRKDGHMVRSAISKALLPGASAQPPPNGAHESRQPMGYLRYSTTLLNLVYRKAVYAAAGLP
ncbi:hypothetical protein GY45DRAFT_1316197 [Cubamyces sp. BRFM 1775]|nr:hypothetical protein GY45DRAFT_1316197 [Cubamyces sp. BRFM 1775]